MDDTQDHTKLFAQFLEQEQQRHGICPTRHRHAHAVPGPHHLLLPQAIEDAWPEHVALIRSTRILASSTSHKSPITLLAHRTTSQALSAPPEDACGNRQSRVDNRSAL